MPSRYSTRCYMLLWDFCFHLCSHDYAVWSSRLEISHRVVAVRSLGISDLLRMIFW